MIVFQFPIGTVYPWALGLVLVLVKNKRQKIKNRRQEIDSARSRFRRRSPSGLRSFKSFKSAFQSM